MNLELNLLHVPATVDLARGLEIIRNSDVMDFVWGFEGSPGSTATIGHEDAPNPWESPSLAQLSEAFRAFDASSSSAREQAWNDATAENQEEFRAAVRWSAERWAESIARVAERKDQWFENSVATWFTVTGSGLLLVAPQNSDGFDSDSLYGDLFVEARGRYATVAAAMGIRAVDIDDVRIEVLPK
jgi:hypothetical protein